jgi:phosphoadenosine phosphosulfate reductase
MHVTADRGRDYDTLRSFDIDDAQDRLACSGLEGQALLEMAIGQGVAGRTAIVSSFGAESVVLLAMAAAVDRSVPVLFLQTDRHFDETLAYRDTVVRALGLTNVRDITPDAQEAARLDPTGDLWWFDPDTCCDMRKVRPLERALEGFDSWVTGRKRHQAATRASLPAVEREAGRIKLNPLAGFSAGRLMEIIRTHDLPRHPLVARGYPSIGCATCTRPVRDGESERDGRWAGSRKVECGIHRAA